MNSRLARLAQLIGDWPGLVSGAPEPLIEDCLVLLDHLDGERSLVDVGSGGGLPGLVLKLERPSLQVTLVEADRAKAAFLVQAAARLGLTRIDVVGRRAEDAAHDERYRGAFDVATARALAPLPVVVELCLPFVRTGGRLLAQKTEREPVDTAAHAIEVLGGAPAGVHAAPSGARRDGTVVVVKKVRPTPALYPRRAGVPARKPL